MSSFLRYLLAFSPHHSQLIKTETESTTALSTDMFRFLFPRAQSSLLIAASVLKNASHLIRHSSGFPLHETRALPVLTFATRSLHHTATSAPRAFASVDPTGLRVRWSDAPDASHDVFPLVWLRAHCQCPKCFHPDTLSRQILARELLLHPQIANYTVQEGHIEVLWDDGHESIFKTDWLKERSFKKPLMDVAHPKRELWGAGFSPNVFDFGSTFGSDSAMLEFLLEFKIRGICVLKDCPRDALEQLAEAVFDFPFETHYGKFFEVQNKPSPSNLAYTAAELGLHSDLPFMEQIPDIQALHCILQTDDLDGGANIFSDVSFVANRLKVENPKAFELLTTEKASFMDIGKDAHGDFHMRWSRPVITFNPDTEDFAEVAYNHAVLDSFLNVSLDRVQPWFEALVLFQKLLVEESIRWRLHSGELVIFDNRRCLHGREGYHATSERFLRGCYFIWSHAESRIRVLHNSLQGSK